MLFYHFFPPLCFFANRFLLDEEAAKQIAEMSLEKLWNERSGMKDWEAIKIFLYLNTYQACARFIKTPQIISDSVKTPGNGLSITEEAALAMIVYAELLNSLEDIAGSPEWLSARLTLIRKQK
jgi:RNA polymerase sigma-70 factor (ECF subfamily)